MKKQPVKQKSKPVTKTASVKSINKSNEPKVQGRSFFEKFEIWAEASSRWLIWVIVGTSVLCSILLFDLRFSIGGDDSAYVQRAYDFLKKGQYPYYQGPGYPLILALQMKIFGFHTGIFKLFSLIFYAAHIALTWFAFKRRIPYMMLIFMVGFAVVSDYMQYYASQTWSEAFYMFIQALVLWIIMKVVSIENQEEKILDDIKKRWPLWLAAGLALAFLAMTKTVAVFAIIAPVIYLIIQKKYRYAIFIALSFLVFKFGIGAIEKAAYGPDPSSSQWEQMRLKDGYNPNQEKLDFVGFLGRFGENLKTYSSMHFFRFLHIIPKDKYKLSEDGSTLDEEKEAGKVITFFVTVIILLSSFVIFRRNKQAFFLVVYTFIMCGGIFFGIHANNRQDRLIIILFPFILTIIFYGGYLALKNIRVLHGVFGILLSVVLLSSLYHTLAKAPESLTTLQKNLSGDKYYGFSTDWVNYIKMSEWCANNLPEGSIVAVRKPEISFIYTHKQMWHMVNKIPPEGQDSADYWLKRFKDASVTHMLIADLRAVPTKKTNKLISTLHKAGQFIVNRYPNKLKLVHTIGNDEKARLFEIRYND